VQLSITLTVSEVGLSRLQLMNWFIHVKFQHTTAVTNVGIQEMGRFAPEL